MTKADIKNEIDRRLDGLAKNHQITRETILAGLLRAIQIAEEDRNPSAAARGWAEINRMLGFHDPDRTEARLSASAEKRLQQIESLPTEKLMEMIEGEMRK